MKFFDLLYIFARFEFNFEQFIIENEYDENHQLMQNELNWVVWNLKTLTKP